MENQRLILFFALTLVLFLLWDAWQTDYGPAKQPEVAQTESTTPSVDAPKDVPAMKQPLVKQDALGTVPVAPKVDVLNTSQRIRVMTDTLDLIIDTRGGDIRDAKLLDYPVSIEQLDVPFHLMKDTLPNLFVAQNGLLSTVESPDHYAVFTAQNNEYILPDGQEELRVPLTWQGENGLKVTKTIILTRGSHVVDIEQRIDNGTGETWTGRQYRQLQRSRPDGSGESAFIYTYTGGVIYSEENKYEKIDFDDMADANLSRDITGGWAAMIQHYFLAAIIPDASETNHFYSKAPGDDRYVLGLVSSSKTIEPGQLGTFTSRYYVGPKNQADLEKLAEDLDLTVDYGMLSVIAKPLFWVLDWLHSMLGNWGWAIIAVTLVIKLVFYPLSAASYRSMANMRKLAPKMQQMKERYGDDRQRMSQAMMELYKKEKINPLGGCLPMLVQIPVFISLYWVLLESVELRQAPFIFWIQDLSIKDPYYVLPLLMGVSMYIQQKLNPPPPDPIQAKIMQALPIIFTLFFAFFPAGLVLYWLANSVLSVAQQWYITAQIENADKAKAKS